MAPSVPPGAAATVLAASVIRQSLIPMAALYVIFMTALGLGLLRLQRGHRPGRGEAEPGPEQAVPGPEQGPPGTEPGTKSRGDRAARRAEGELTWEQAAAGDSRGWWALARHIGVTIVAGYLLLMAVAFGYYFAIARVSGNFLDSAVTGPALLIALSMPLYAALTWLLITRRKRDHTDG